MTLDVSLDYLHFDFLVSVEYYSATGSGTYTDGVTVNNCSFLGQLQTGNVAGNADLRRTYSALIVRQNEWSEALAAAPRRGDKFVFDATTYVVESVAGDPVRLKQWVLRCYAI